MLGVVLDADSLGKDIDLTPITQLLDDSKQVGLSLAMVFLGDELCCGGVPLTNLTAVARYLRAAVGSSVLLWTNECPGSFSEGIPGSKSSSSPSHISTVPLDLDLISFDHVSHFAHPL